MLIKKMDLFVLKKFLLFFFGSFFITLFVFMMQFTWRYVDELIGKGLTVDILAEFFWYMGLTLVALSLPLAILLASLISFGNMGEQLELLAMKAAGVPLLRIMAPVLVLVIGFSATSFYFQNNISPDAQLKLKALLLSMKQTSPALEIPEGVFYNGVPGYSIFVEKKDITTGKLYNLMIYKTDQGFDRAQIVVADSGRMEVTTDRMHLVLDIWDGEQFENLQSKDMQAMGTRNQPYDRETFRYKRFIIDFDTNFEKLDEEQLRDLASAKNLTQLQESVDSANAQLDSMGRTYYNEAKVRFFPDSRKKVKSERISFDSIMAQLPADVRNRVVETARTNVSSLAAEVEWKGVVVGDGERFVRRHEVAWHEKFTLSLACLLFFFIGAPLGAIIRKGGLGMPAVISVIIFIIYYIINTSGMKMARDGSWNMIYGMWISTGILLPMGIFLTYKANNDSVVFNIEAYMAAVRNFLGLRSSRHIFRKEVIIDDPHYDEDVIRLQELKDCCIAYGKQHKLRTAPNYLRIFFNPETDSQVENIGNIVEELVSDLSNSKDAKVLHGLETFPQIYAKAHLLPFKNRKINVACGIVIPVGIVFWLRIWIFRLRLYRDMKQIVKTADYLLPFVEQKKLKVEN